MSITNPNFKFLTCGIDSLYAGYSVDLASSRIDFEDLDFQKALLKDDPKRRCRTIDIGGLPLGILASGSYPYRWILSDRRFQIKLAKRMQPGCSVHFSSEALWHDGIDNLDKVIRNWFTDCDITTLAPEILSRIDYAFDYQIPSQDFAINDFVSRAQKDSAWRNRSALQTLTFGKGDIVIRIYDKSAEIREQSKKTWFYDLWGVRDHVWRIEFQVRREALKRHGLNTVSDCQTLIGDVLRELATHHTSLRRPTGDGNRSRWPLHPLWQDLLSRIDNLPKIGLCRSYAPQNAIELRKRLLAQSIAGNLKGYAALTALSNSRERPPDFFETLDDLASFGEQEIVQPDWDQDVQQRISDYEVGQW